MAPTKDTTKSKTKKSSKSSPPRSSFPSVSVAPAVGNGYSRRQTENSRNKSTNSDDEEENGTSAKMENTNIQMKDTTTDDVGDGDDSMTGQESPIQEAVRSSSRNSSLTLPSLSRAALMHLSDHGHSNERSTNSSPVNRLDNGNSTTAFNSDEGNNNGRQNRRSRSRSQEDQDYTNRNGNGRWNGPPEKDGDDRGSNYSGDENRPNDSPPPGQEGHDMRIMFHGREIYADDLIGLRVAKTFVGHGRFLGQIVKFDEPTTLYTVVYADGDAEELSIEHTIQILIQDEIERADSSISSATSTFRHDRIAPIPASPDGDNSTPVSSSASNTAAIAPIASITSMPHVAPVVPIPPMARHSTISISEREAQFVIGLFENHALPVLLRQGWRVQSEPSSCDRYVAPPGNFRGAGRVFSSAIDVVELIASDNEMLTVCFPQNVHSAILSLFPEPPPTRKRPTGDTMEASGYDTKRVRPGRDDIYRGPPMVRTGGPGGAVGGFVSRGASDRMGPSGSYRVDEPYTANRAQERFSGPHSSRGSLAPGGRPGLQDPAEYRRGPPGDYRQSHHSFSPEGNEGGHWSAPSTGMHHPDRRSYGEPADWYDRRPQGPGYPGHRMGHPGEEQMGYYNDRTIPNGTVRGPPGSHTGVETSSISHRFHDIRQAPPQYTSSPDSFSQRYPSGRDSPAEYRGARVGPPSATQERFVRSLNGEPGRGLSERMGGPGRGFSMMDVDQNSRPTAAPVYERGRSPHSIESGMAPGGAYPPHGHYSRHQRSASNGSHYSIETSQTHSEPRSTNPSNPADDTRTL